MVDVMSQEFQSAIATAALAAATSATSAMGGAPVQPGYPQQHALAGYPGYPMQPQQQPYYAHYPYYAAQQPAARLPSAAAQPSSEPPPSVEGEGGAPASRVAPPSGATPPPEVLAELQEHNRWLQQRLMAEEEARRRVEDELRALRGKFDELQASAHQAEVHKCVAEAKAKAAEDAAKERKDNIKKLEEQVKTPRSPASRASPPGGFTQIRPPHRLRSGGASRHLCSQRRRARAGAEATKGRAACRHLGRSRTRRPAQCVRSWIVASGVMIERHLGMEFDVLSLCFLARTQDTTCLRDHVSE
eukprot:4691561-Prymnesium_polylepis.1